MRRVWVLPWCLVVHFERFAALWVRVVSRRLVCDVHTRDLKYGEPLRVTTYFDLVLEASPARHKCTLNALLAGRPTAPSMDRTLLEASPARHTMRSGSAEAHAKRNARSTAPTRSSRPVLVLYRHRGRFACTWPLERRTFHLVVYFSSCSYLPWT